MIDDANFEAIRYIAENLHTHTQRDSEVLNFTIWDFGRVLALGFCYVTVTVRVWMNLEC